MSLEGLPANSTKIAACSNAPATLREITHGACDEFREIWAVISKLTTSDAVLELQSHHFENE